MKKGSTHNSYIEDRTIGSLLSKNILNLEKGDCPSFEEIAALIDKRVKGKRRDEIMKHLSCCDRCYKVFLISSHLIEKKSTRKYHIFHPMALAASILIVVLSIFLFYRSNTIPKTSKQLIEKSKISSPDIMISKGKGTVLQEGEEVKYERAPLVSSKKDKIQKKDIKDVSISKKMGIENKNLEIKSNEKEIKEHEPGTKSIQDEKLRDKESFDCIYVEKIGEEKAQKGAITPPTKSKLEGHLKERYPDEKREKSKKRIEEPRRKISYARTVEPGLKRSNWEIVDSLNVKLENYKKYVPSNDIEKLYEEALSVSLKLNNDFEELRQESIKSNIYNNIESSIKRVKPSLSAFIKEDAIYTYPDINYFLLKCQPGTIEYRFFLLANSGYCISENFCYKSKNIKQDLLPSWKRILPELKGVFLKIAIQTINHINKN